MYRKIVCQVSTSILDLEQHQKACLLITIIIIIFVLLKIVT